MNIPQHSFRGAVLCALLVVIATAACTRHRDRFWPDTANGLLALTDPRVIAGDSDRMVRLESTGASWEPSAVRRLSHTLRVGDRAVVGVAVPVDGEYRHGGGWIFSGRTYVGRHGLAGDLLVAESSRPEVLKVAHDQYGNLELSALAKGESTVTLSATMSRRYADRPDNAETFTDSVVFVVE